MINTLICTVGTSVMGNLTRLSNDSGQNYHNKDLLIRFFGERNPFFLAKEMLKIDPSDPLCGAEINTVEELVKREKIDLQRLFLLVSDTEEGDFVGKLLVSYFCNRTDLELNKNSCEFKSVQSLQDKDPKMFKMQGLRNLVREIGYYIQRAGDIKYVAIDATGGYKAQIAIAVLIGQALSIPVFYKHERFNEIIDFPPLPICLDFDIIGYYSDILDELENSNIININDLDPFDDKLLVFLNVEEIDQQKYLELNHLGQLYLTTFRLKYPLSVKLLSAPDEKREKPSFRDDHYPKGFKEFVEKVWKENEWITTCSSLSYEKQKSIREIGFKVIEDKGEKKLIGTFIDSNSFGARFRVFLASEDTVAINLAADNLNQKYRTRY